MVGSVAVPAGARLVDDHTAEWIAANGVPGTELHVDGDATWIAQPGAVWGNAVCRLRFTAEEVEARLSAQTAAAPASG